MSRLRSAFLSAALLASVPLLAQSYLPTTIQFKGATGYTDDELLAAAGLKHGAWLTQPEMNDRTKQLLDTGAFDKVSFTYNGKDLVFEVVPSTTLTPPNLDNLPLAFGPELEAKLEARVPLYHGKLPGAGTLVEAVRKALEAELNAKSIDATVIVLQSIGQEGTVTFAESIPTVRVGEIHLQGASAAQSAAAAQLAAKVTGSEYHLQGSSSVIETALANFYHEHGYLEAAIHATPQFAPVVDGNSVHLPFQVAVDEGPQYHLGAVSLDPAMLAQVVQQASFDKQVGLHPGDVAVLEKLRAEWLYLERQYHNRGYMRAQISPVPTYDRPKAIVDFSVTAVAGPVYTMGKLTIANVNDDLRKAMTAAWTLPEGAVFNESAIVNMTATHGVNPALERYFTTVSLRYSLHLNDEARTVDVALRLEKKGQ